MIQMLLQPVSFSDLLSCLGYAAAYETFFRRMRTELTWKRRLFMLLADLTGYLILMRLLPRTEYLRVLLLHLILAAASTLQLRLECRLDWSYAVFLGTSFVLYRGVWNAQLSALLLPWLEENALLRNAVNQIVSLLLLYALQKWVVRMDRTRTVNRYELFVSLFPACVMFTVRIAIYHYCFYLEAVLAARGVQVFVLLGGLLGISTLVTLGASEMYFSYIHTQEKLQLAEQQLQQQYRLFQEQRTRDEQLKGVYHDMANHLGVLRGMTRSADAEEYIAALTRETETALQGVSTGNSTLDLILRQKAEQCTARGLHLEAAVHMPEGHGLTSMELCVLFANCLDNAMESAADPAVTDKVIRVNGGEHHGCLVVRFENACARSLQLKDGQLPTSKKSGVHGYGLKNIRTVLERHDGTLSLQPQRGRFVLTWLLPLDQKAPVAFGQNVIK